MQITRDRYIGLLNVEIEFMKAQDLISDLKRDRKAKSSELRRLQNSLGYLKKKVFEMRANENECDSTDQNASSGKRVKPN